MLLMVFQLLVPLEVASATMGEPGIPIEATIYAYKHYGEILEVVKEYVDYYDVTKEQLKEVKLNSVCDL